MPLLVLCPRCKRRLGVREADAGKTIKCPSCLQPFRLPAGRGKT